MLAIGKKFAAGDAAVVARHGGLKRVTDDPELSDALRRAFRLWREMKAIEAEFLECKSLIAQRAGEISGGSAVVFSSGEASCTVAPRHEAEVPEENVPALRRLLGRRFRHLVRTKARHFATARLLDEADPEALALVEMTALSPRLRWGHTTDECPEGTKQGG